MNWFTTIVLFRGKTCIPKSEHEKYIKYCKYSCYVLMTNTNIENKQTIKKRFFVETPCTGNNTMPLTTVNETYYNIFNVILL